MTALLKPAHPGALAAIKDIYNAEDIDVAQVVIKAFEVDHGANRFTEADPSSMGGPHVGSRTLCARNPVSPDSNPRETYKIRQFADWLAETTSSSTAIPNQVGDYARYPHHMRGNSEMSDRTGSRASGRGSALSKPGDTNSRSAMTSSGQYSTASAAADGIRRALTAYQRDVWTSNELTPGAPSYVTSIVAHLIGDLDTDVLAQCIARVWQRNDGLRLTFGMCDGVPYQMLAEEMPPIERRDVSAADDPAAAARNLVRATVATPIDLAAGVPLRILMIRDGVTSLRVLLLSHHVAMDATGLFNFATNWLAEYACMTTTGSPAASPATSFIDCLESEHAYRGSAQWTRDRDSLIDQLRGATPALFDRQGAGASRPTVRQHHAWLDRSLVNQLRERNILFFPYLCAIAGTYLTRVLRTDEVTLGVPLTNRTSPVEKVTR